MHGLAYDCVGNCLGQVGHRLCVVANIECRRRQKQRCTALDDGDAEVAQDILEQAFIVVLVLAARAATPC